MYDSDPYISVLITSALYALIFVPKIICHPSDDDGILKN